MALNNMGDALDDLGKVLEVSPSDKVAQADKDCLQALTTAAAEDGDL